MSVTNIHGGLNPQFSTEPNEKLISYLRASLERAEAGETVGMAAIELWRDKTTSWATVGLVGSHSMIGACEMAKLELMRVTEGDDE